MPLLYPPGNGRNPNRYKQQMIFYFSATGNTKWAAKALAEATGEQPVFIPHALKGSCHYELENQERVGFCFPVHGWRPPTVVREFLKRLSVTVKEGREPANHTYTYALITAGDTMARTKEIFEADLRHTQLTLSAVCNLVMPEAYVGLPGMNTDTPRNEKAKINAARERLNEFIGVVQQRSCGYEHLVKGPVPAFFSGPVGAFFVRHLVTDKPFRVESSRCVKCGICADVCPVDNIRGGLGHEPAWLHNGSCLTCFACYHHCPHHAIEFGQRTKHKGQYFFGKRK